ncbi:PRAME family member 12 [Heterocephalus glaber]|uniref:PRAME family member 12 n=1 Tax=Heterocephalus glaber TaxID=10181 RepID=G5BDA3_HETGA|nr:PRAME family member 12 [Heterocephalus glaber]EHB07264.1 PRAME family member 12 [Heterocephalus glaber]
MSKEAPNTLLHLAIQRLLRNKDLVIQALEDLPGDLFQPLFLEAFTRGHTEVLKAMVPAWPFYCLPLGTLMHMRKQEASETHLHISQLRVQYLQNLQAMLDGLDVLLAQKVRPRRWKLQVLDLRNTQQDFWKASTENPTQACSPVAASTRKMEKNGSNVEEKQPLKVIIDLHIRMEYLLEFLFQFYLLDWVEKRKGSLQLDCRKLHIGSVPIRIMRKAIEMVDLSCVLEADLCPFWSFSTLASFAPYLGQMQNLHKLILSHISAAEFIPTEKGEQLANQFTSQILKLHCLQEIYINSASFLKGHLNQILGSLQSPLENLSITDCWLSHSDWNHLSRFPSTWQLKHLYLSEVRLFDFPPEPLQVLLEIAAGTLTTLHLEACGFSDSQLCAIIPALGQCSKLATFRYIRNCISVATLESLLCRTARMSNLRMEQYPVPWEICGGQNAAHQIRLGKIRDALKRIMKPLNYPRMICFNTSQCDFCGNSKIHYKESIRCPDYIFI